MRFTNFPAAFLIGIAAAMSTFVGAKNADASIFVNLTTSGGTSGPYSTIGEPNAIPEISVTPGGMPGILQDMVQFNVTSTQRYASIGSDYGQASTSVATLTNYNNFDVTVEIGVLATFANNNSGAIPFFLSGLPGDADLRFSLTSLADGPALGGLPYTISATSWVTPDSTLAVVGHTLTNFGSATNGPFGVFVDVTTTSFSIFQNVIVDLSANQTLNFQMRTELIPRNNEPPVVPEPASLAIWSLGALGLGLVRLRRRTTVA